MARRRKKKERRRKEIEKELKTKKIVWKGKERRGFTNDGGISKRGLLK